MASLEVSAAEDFIAGQVVTLMAVEDGVATLAAVAVTAAVVVAIAAAAVEVAATVVEAMVVAEATAVVAAVVAEAATAANELWPMSARFAPSIEETRLF